MKLHHTTGTPDWAEINPAARNIWQRMAATTNSVFTPGNVLSLGGLVLVGVGVVQLFGRNFGWAALWIAIGRVLDVADGMVAEATGTKSPLGEAVDATFDKLSTLAVLIAVAAERIAPWWAVIFIALHHAVNSVVAYVGWRHRLEIRPERAGKLSTALEWAAFCCFMLAAFQTRAWLWLAYTTLIPALGVGVVASVGYARKLLSAFSAASVEASSVRRTSRMSR